MTRECLTIGDILDYLPGQQHLIIILEDGSQLFTAAVTGALQR